MSEADLKKNIRPEDSFGTENLDPTSSVTKLLKDMSSKNSRAFSFYTKTLGIKHKYSCGHHCDVVGHSLSCFPADYDGSVPMDYFEEFSYKSNLPFYISPIYHIGIQDPLTEIIKIKKMWSDELGRLYKRPDALIKKYEKINEEVVKCPQRLIDAAKCLEREPEKHFNSAYNWYYTGHGNLHLLTINSTQYLLHSELSYCCLTPFSKDDMETNYYRSIKYDCGEQNNILETIYSDNCIVTLRTKNKVIILKIELSGEKLIFRKLKEVMSTTPYTGIAFDGYHKNILYLTSLDDTLKIINLNRMTGKTVQLHKTKSLLNNWSTVRYINRTEYVHVSRSTITIYDKRTHTERASWSDLHKYVNIKCDDITSVLVCGQTPYIYIGSSHHLFCLDIRHSPTVLHRWTHGMRLPPTYISKCDFELDRELLCMTSQWCDDMCLIVNDSTKIENYVQPSVATLSYRPPSIRATLKEARSKSLCSDLYNPVDARLFTGISGVLLTDKDDKYIVLMQNSLGDVTCHTLYPKHLQHIMDDSSPEKLHEWCQTYKLQKKKFILTDTINVACLWERLKEVPEGYKFFKDNTKNNFHENEIFDIFKSGTLDPGLLEAWGIDQEETQSASLSVES